MGVISEETLLKNEAIKLEKEFQDCITDYNVYSEIYRTFETNEYLVTSLGFLHNKIIECIEVINSAISNNRELRYHDSQNVKGIYRKTQQFLNNLKSIDKFYSVNKNVKQVFDYLNEAEEGPYGKILLNGIDEIEISDYEVLFISTECKEVYSGNSKRYSPLLRAGSGSYATVKYYHDPTYDCKIAVKIAKSSLTDRERTRFKREYDVLKKLDSPYIIKVFNYYDDNDRPEYTMEYVRKTLNTFIEELRFEKNSNSIRISLVRQIFRAMRYVHSKKYLHRDLSYTNILVKKHDDKSYIIKLCDFGLVKTKDSTLTCKSTDGRGSLNEPRIQEDIGSYSKIDEVYSLTQIIFYIMTGDKHASLKKHNSSEQMFYNTGMNSDYDKRYADLDELEVGFKKTEWQNLNK